MEDADKQRPYYGRGVGAGYHFPRTPMPDRLDGWGLGRGRVLARLDSPKPGHTSRRIRGKHAQPSHTGIVYADFTRHTRNPPTQASFTPISRDTRANTTNPRP